MIKGNYWLCFLVIIVVVGWKGGDGFFCLVEEVFYRLGIDFNCLV